MIKGISVLFENDSCLVLNKPAGLSVQGGEGVKVSLDSILTENLSPRPFLVHRLDKDTSGIILIARNREAAHLFSLLFSGQQSSSTEDKAGKGKLIIKKYLGVCKGIPKPGSGTIRFDIDVRGNKKKSRTSYKLLDSCIMGGESVSLLELELDTGRMHQIRRHLSLMGHPLLGDDKYGDFSINKKLKKTAGLKHLLLHASGLTIPPLPEILPEGMDISAPLPDYFPKTAPFSFPNPDYLLRK